MKDKKIPIYQRIRTALNGETTAQYHELMYKVFPVDKYPNAYRNSPNGGPRMLNGI